MIQILVKQLKKFVYRKTFQIKYYQKKMTEDIMEWINPENLKDLIKTMRINKAA